MPFFLRRFFLLLLLLAGSAAALAQTPPPAPPDDGRPPGDRPPGGRPPGALSPRNANYTIDVTLDAAERMLHGRQVVRWRNLQEQPTDELYFHLYWNAWRNNQSTWLRESRQGARRGRVPKQARQDDWGYLVVERARLATSRHGDLDPSLASAQDTAFQDTGVDRRVLEDPEPDLGRRFAAPDDGNPFDRTVMVVQLPGQVAQGEEVEIELTWHAKVPRTVARTGVRGEHYFIAHWFPKLGVYEADGWNCHQYHAATEYFSDYGSYDVRLTLPESYVVGATGRETESLENGDGTVTHRFQQDDVHAFTWTASPHYRVATARFEEEGLPPVDMRLLYQPEHEHQVERHFDATRAALKFYGTWYGPYPYGHVTIVDPAWGLGAGGMEYPTLFTAGSSIWRPFGGGSPEGVTVHEAGHQFWYGIVGNNEFEHAWIDEGLNTFSTRRTLQEAYGATFETKPYFHPPRGFGPFIGVPFRDVVEPPGSIGGRWSGFVGSRAWDVQAGHTFRYYPQSAGAISYSKTALWLITLERQLGWDVLQKILSTFFERFKFHHPTPEDFVGVANEVALDATGEDLDWFFDQVLYDSVRFDYAVASATTERAEPKGFVEADDGGLRFADHEDDEDDENDETKAGEDDGGATFYRNEVVVRRLEDGVFPVEILMVFEDGSEKRFAWDGRERWKLFVEERPSKLDWAAVDPDRKLLLDVDYSNNSRLIESRAELPARKWASKWMIWLQDYLQALTFFI